MQFILIILLSLSSLCASQTCQFTTEPVTNNLGRNIRSWVWTEPYQSDLFRDGNVQGGAAYENFTAYLNTIIPRNFDGLDPFDQRACLVHQKEVFENVGYGDTRNFDVILDGTVNGLYQVNCVESLLWGIQNKFHPQSFASSEFGSFIMLDAQNTTLKVYAQTSPEIGVPPMRWAYNKIADDFRNGFRMLTFLHYHPFFPDNKYQDCAGTCIPSPGDLNAYASFLKEFPYESAWITNGFDSLRFPLSELGLFYGEYDGEDKAVGQGKELLWEGAGAQ